MSKTQRKRAVVLALIAFFCTAASVSVDWRRFGGGFLAFFKGRGGPIVVTTGARTAGSDGVYIADIPANPHDSSSRTVLAVATPRRHPASNTAGTGNGDEDLFKYGNPAAGGIPPGSFIVARNDTPPTGERGMPTPTADPIAPEITGGPTPGGVTTPAPAPTIGGGTLPVIVAGTPAAPTPAPTPAPAPASGTPPSPATPAPAPTPNPSGTTDPDGDGATPPPPPPSVSVIPEPSSLKMIALGALFVAVAAARRRRTR